MNKFKKVILALAMCIVTMMQGIAMENTREEYIRSMDPQKIATDEMNIWQSYYVQKYEETGAHMKAWIEGVFGVADATELTPLFIQAMAVFGKMCQDSERDAYNEKVLPLLVSLFEKINKGSVFKFKDPSEAAARELQWWVDRRFKDKLDPENIGAIMADVYGNLYGGSKEQYEKATYLRASAARYRDLSQDKWEGSKDEDWSFIQTTLTASYAELKRVLLASLGDRTL